MDQQSIDALRDLEIAPQSMIVDGQSVSAHSGEELDVISPANGRKLTSIPSAGAMDVDLAVVAARRQFDLGTWRKQPPAARKKVLHRWADLVEAHALELAVLGVRDNGTEISMAYKAEPMSAAGTIRYYAEALDKVYGEIAPTADDVLALIHKEPVGVVGAIIPWNFPLMIGAWKLGPALAAGNSVVLKPAETASLSLLRMAELAHEAGLPQGVLNVITGNGVTAGQSLARSMDVDVLVFTGSGGVGRRLLEYSAQSNLKRVYLELGGKIVDGIKASSSLFREEIFGPILSVTSFRDDNEAVDLANDSELGLASGVWTDDLSRAHRMISEVQTGVVHVNTYGGADGTVPLGGYKQSGNGQDKSLHAFEKFINKKTAWIKL